MAQGKGEPAQAWLFCKRGLMLLENNPTKRGTVSIGWVLAQNTPKRVAFATGQSTMALRTPTRLRLALYGYAGQESDVRPRIESRQAPTDQRTTAQSPKEPNNALL
jgi:hypothetical protein